VIQAIAPTRNIIFSDKRRPADELNYIYNIADCTINIANNEGFGLTTAESVMSGTQIIVNVTGGLQDQVGFTKEGKLLTHEDYIEIGSLNDWRKWEQIVDRGEWATPIWPRTQTMAGSVPTPYIIDDRIDVVELATIMREVYEFKKHNPEGFSSLGLQGREAFINELGLTKKSMCDKMADGIMTTLQNWTPREKYSLYKIK
jgi:glycosyltransferase involved in cell wall biosynthesis